MKFRTLGYYLNVAVRNLIKNRLMSVASVLTVASCIFIVSVFYCLAANLDYLLKQMESNIGITVFVDDALDPEAAMDLLDKIVAIPHVLSAEYVSPEKALVEVQVILDDPEAIEGLEQDNPFRRSFNILIDDIQYQEDVVQVLVEMESAGVARIRYSQAMAEITLTISGVVRVVSMILILMLGIISIVIIFNTIRITVNARRTEINIMKYVGATDWFIRWPFVFEGLLIGLAGGIIPAALCWLGYNRVIGMIREGLPIISFIQFRPGFEIFSYLIPFALLLGILIGTVGSLLSVRRHLKV